MGRPSNGPPKPPSLRATAKQRRSAIDYACRIAAFTFASVAASISGTP